MPTLLTQLDAAFRAALRAALGFDADPLLGPAQNAKFGDYQSNAAMGLAKRVAETTGEKTNPRVVAERVVAHLDLGEMAVEKPTIAGPGFINVRIAPAYLAKRIEAVTADPARLGVEPVASPQTVVIDYSAPNVAKQMHVGNARSTILGDAISRVLAFRGDRVIRQNHIGDWGTQFGMLVAFLQAAGEDGADAHLADLDAFYKQARQRFDADPAFADEARATVVRLQAGGKAELAMWAKFVGESRRMLEATYARLGVLLTPADERGESFYNPMLPAVVADLTAAGVARQSEGAVVVFTDGVEAPLIVEKTGGGHGYATTDLAAIRYRVDTLRADRVLYFVGSTQAQHFRQVFAAARQAGWAGAASLEHAAFGSILGADGKMFKARSGDSVKLADLLDEADRRGLALAKAKDDERGRGSPRAGQDRCHAGSRGRVGSGRPCRGRRRDEVRRPLQGPHRRLHVRLGHDAGDGRQHGPVPAVRLRPNPVDLPPGGRSRRRRHPADGGRGHARRPAGGDACPGHRPLRRRRRPRRTGAETALPVRVPVRPGDGVQRVL